MGNLPSGTVTFLFTDIEGSTRLLRATGDRYSHLLETHRAIIRRATERHNGHEVGTEGDSFFIAFTKATDALCAAFDAQRELCAHPWSRGEDVRVRMGMHTGEATVVREDYVGLAVHQAARIASAAHGRQVLISSTTRSVVGDALPDGVSLRDLGFHRLKDIEQPQQLFQIVHAELPSEFPSATTITSRPGNLPESLTSFVGRRDDLNETKRIAGSSRLVTLTGAGGVGKTRLALELAATLIESHADGAWLVDLAPVAEPELVMQTVGFALGLRDEQGGGSWNDRVVDHLREKDALLVFDNCEHLLAACADVVILLLRSCPQVRCVATTREPLGIEGEVAWRVPSLGSADDAVALFIERVREVSPTFDASSQTEVIAEICAHLDGIPLAIELAAARTQALSPQQILERLDDRFRLLRGGGRRRVERQQTLRAAVDWSYELLGDLERTLLRRAAVFSGGFTLDAAEAVCGGDGVDPLDVLDLVEGLVRKSLVVFEADLNRYRMLETIRQYALEKLISSDEATLLRQRHREFFAELARSYWRHLLTDEISIARRVESDLDNVRSALEWSSSPDDGRIALEMCGLLATFFLSRGYASEGLRRCRAALDTDGGLARPERVDALMGASILAFHLGDVELSAAFAEEARELITTLPDWPRRPFDEANSLVALACRRAIIDRDGAGALQLCEDAVDVGRRADDAYATGFSLFNVISFASATGNIDRMRSALAEAEGNPAPLSLSLGWHPHRATLFAVDGDLPRALEEAEKGLTLARKIGTVFPVMRALNQVASLSLRAGDPAKARACAEEALVMSRGIGEIFNGVQPALMNLAEAAIALGDGDTALQAIDEALKLPGAPRETLERLQTSAAELAKDNAP